MDAINYIESKHLKKKLTEFRPGDTVRVHVKVVEGDKERTQVFEGIVTSKRGSGMRSSFTVRKVSGGVGVERIFPLHSTSVSRVTLVREGRVKKAKLFYLRKKKGKSARVQEKQEEMPAQKDTQTKPQ
ncbi:MAG: 50S ribosomal protein L19 [Candidatus Eisenbacteria bacterium]|nr:50S ribosomal protein L19 [Candidatus Eisenbacteria bacterium]